MRGSAARGAKRACGADASDARRAASDQPARRLRSYVDDYWKEEILAEGLVRSLPPFAQSAAALVGAELPTSEW